MAVSKIAEHLDDAGTVEAAKAPAASAPAIVQEENENYIKFAKPYVFEDETYDGVDLSGIEDLSARDMITVQRKLDRTGAVSALPEMSMEYALMFASMGSKLPVEFFEGLPPREAMKVKNRVTLFFYGAD